ncbi:MAG: hypothetical protein K6F10_04940 [Paludibacteraceae bacterium]|nr:hypothetical protein [Paludibacteraceae bacterium]
MMVSADSYAVKVTKTVLQNALVQVNKVKKVKCYADLCEHRIGIPYVENGNERQVLDVYYAKEFCLHQPKGLSPTPVAHHLR